MNGIARTIWLLLTVLILPQSSVLARRQGLSVNVQASASNRPTAYKFDKIADGVYYATASGSIAAGGNIVVIVNDTDVMLVDDGVTPAAATALLEDLKTLTDKPVRWVVNTHFHFDHTDGNSIFGPDVEIIGHDYVRYAILHNDVLHHEPFKTSVSDIPGRIDALRKQISSEKDSARRASLEQQIGVMEDELEQIKAVKPTPPTMTYSSKLTMFRGDREIQILFLGKAHTQGDSIVFLPKEKIVCTGDVIEARPAYMGDGIFDQWIVTLDALKSLDFDTALPGHGDLFHGKETITAYQSYLRDLLNQIAKLRDQGMTAEDAAKTVDLTSHAQYFPQIQGPGADLRGVRRIYEWMDEQSKPK
jgi:cyclase